ncbi:glycerophosphodiester phosphodiesterase [Actinotalea fermentans]|uniref:Glycerophosphodiester phosphodiesterase n=1 Tax=Actinotalea fermentans TaxID=43671 RepID=A0A511Z0V6_9CELL|nr:glycerophosphodiester phosphodiesterase family protein [Actinotalea fermentans]KGM16170.1 glycerophosphodiester phosphodiesterase [Actinotalea fermentans ATCC 43279 = JCM 9966 = DSM 3133]GEN81088.1 glycerophosphodiester phosphodiesterase [Actinotalea fermentans]
MKVIAHRGNSWVAPENTLAAFEAAWRAGADSIELDVHLTADREVVVIHDDTVDATTDGSGAVGELALADVRALDAGAWFGTGFAGQRVPTFAEVLAFLGERAGIELLLELKGSWSADDVRLVTEPLAAAGLTDRVIGQSFWPGTVAALGEVAPELRRGLLVLETAAALADVPADLRALLPEAPTTAALVDLCRELGVVTCNPYGPLLARQPDLVPALHAAGLQVMVWTLDEEADWAAAREATVDAVITNRPDRLAGWLATTAAAPRESAAA